MSGLYYDRKGKPIDMVAWSEALKTKKRVAQTTLADGKWVSTVWLGQDYSFEGPPLIFETMVFNSKDDMDELDCESYSTEQEALKGHKLMVKNWTKKIEKG